VIYRLTQEPRSCSWPATPAMSRNRSNRTWTRRIRDGKLTSCRQEDYLIIGFDRITAYSNARPMDGGNCPFAPQMSRGAFTRKPKSGRCPWRTCCIHHSLVYMSGGCNCRSGTSLVTTLMVAPSYSSHLSITTNTYRSTPLRNPTYTTAGFSANSPLHVLPTLPGPNRNEMHHQYTSTTKLGFSS
jgi:hypothetical protein